MENIIAASTPRRSSAILVLLLVENIRTRVPYQSLVEQTIYPALDRLDTFSLAVASNSPFGLSSSARRGELCAGMMVTLPVASSTSCTLPGVLPGKATIFSPRQQRPKGLSAVSKTYCFLGELANPYIWMLVCNAATILCLDSLAPKTEVRNSMVKATFRCPSSQMLSL